jgi:hypothetical protein
LLFIHLHLTLRGGKIGKSGERVRFGGAKRSSHKSNSVSAHVLLGFD